MQNLHQAIEKGELNRVKELMSNNKGMLLLQSQDSIRFSNGMTPLHSACSKGHLHIAKFLFEEYGANPNVRNSKDGMTPLHCACMSIHRYIDSFNIAKYLIEECNANPNHKDNYGCTPFHRACFVGNFKLVQYMIQNNDVVNIHKQDAEGWTALHHAIHITDERIDGFGRHSWDIIKYLIRETDVDVNQQDTNGWTVLHLACQTMDNIDIVKCLVQDSDLSVENKEGNTALHIATSKGHIDIVKILLKHGADPDQENNQYKSAFDLAIEKGYDSVAEIITQNQNRQEQNQ